jgi:beta-lactamase superfamily II metal-dependent hydrolase
MFTIHMLDANHGDCLWIEYGDAERPRRILIDTGPASTYTGSLAKKLEDVVVAQGRCEFELFVITHIDDDHIGGSLRFLDELNTETVPIKEVWFNGYFHLSNERPSELGAMQGEKLTELIRRGRWPWNARFDRRAAMVPEQGPLLTHDVGGMKITLLSPTLERLQALKPEWEETVRAAGLVPGEAFEAEETVLGGGFLGSDVEAMSETRFKEDKTLPNGSSIAFLAEFEGTRVLFAADAHPSVLLQSLQRAPFNGRPQALDAFKLSHHGSAHNTSLELLEAFPAIHYLVSTSGARFKHPNDPAIARVVVSARDRAPVLHFNRESVFNQDWARADRQSDFGYSAVYGLPGEGLRVDLATA